MAKDEGAADVEAAAELLVSACLLTTGASGTNCKPRRMSWPEEPWFRLRLTTRVPRGVLSLFGRISTISSSASVAWGGGWGIWRGVSVYRWVWGKRRVVR